MEKRRRSITCSTSSNVTSPFIFLHNSFATNAKNAAADKNLSTAGKVANSSFGTAKLLVALPNSMKVIDVLLPS